MRGATEEEYMEDPQETISIHAPHAGRDANDPEFMRSMEISIHAPHAGRDGRGGRAARP